MKRAIVIGSGLGGITAGLRLNRLGYEVTILEKHSSAGGRLNKITMDGFSFDMGPTFMSMTYELEEFFRSIDILSPPLELIPLDPLYQVFFEGREKPYQIYKDLNRLEEEFSSIEPGLALKAERYLKHASQFFHDTEYRIIKRNFENKLQYLAGLSKVPLKHLPYLFINMWREASKYFTSEEVRIIFCLVAFFLGDTPFKTPSIYSLLSYTELQHNGYWRIKGGMYRLIEVLIDIMSDRGVKLIYNTEIKEVRSRGSFVTEVIDQNGVDYTADIYVCNSDAAAFRGQVLKRRSYTEARLDKMEWTLAPFTIYLGVKGKLDVLGHHNYFLGSNFKGYASKLFTSSISPQKPYYYVNTPSKLEADSAPGGCENILILCPVPDLRFKKNWEDKNELAQNIIADLSRRTGYDIMNNLKTLRILTPIDWENKFNLYRGSGLGLSHGITQVGGLRPANKDEVFKNLYYAGASTVPGTGLPMVIISSRLVTERIRRDNGYLQ